jgi:periplasmic divalent cation tolerance protein
VPEFDKPENVGETPDAATAGDAGCDVVLVYATFPTLDVAEAIGGALVDARLAACVNIIPGMISIYRWEGARQREAEVSMLIKTRGELADKVVRAVSKRHPYSNPAVLIVPVSGGAQAFLDWIGAEASAGRD